MTDIAVALLSFNRPDYLKQCIESLERNYNSEKYDYIFFQDNAVNKFSNRRLATNEEINKCITILKQADLPNKDIRINQHNLGIAHQRDKVFGLFDEGYDLVFHIEDDIVLGKYALQLLKSMSKQFKPDVCSVYGEQRRYKDMENPKELLDKVIIQHKGVWWITAIWEKAYREIEHDWKRYLDITGGEDYEYRPHDKIQKEFPNCGVSSSDSVCDGLFTKHGIRNIFAAVCRAKYIGRKGVHYTPEQYEEKATGEEGPTEFEEDKSIDEWEVLVNNF